MVLSLAVMFASTFHRVWEIPVYGSPVLQLDSQCVYRSGSEGQFGAYRLRDGSPVWVRGKKTFHSDTWTLLDGATLYIAPEKGPLEACDKRNGRVLWTVKLPNGPAEMLAAGGRIIATRSNGVLTAIDPAKRRLIWKATLPGTGWVQQLAANSTRVFVDGTDGFVRAYDAKTGHPAWSKYRDKEPSFGSALTPSLFITASSGHDVYAYALADGKLAWKTPAPGSPQDGLTISGGRVYFTTTNSHAVCVDAANGHIVWDTPLSDSREYARTSPVTIHGNEAIVTLFHDVIHLDAATGAVRSKWDSGQDLFRTEFAWVGDDMIVATPTNVYRFAPGEGQDSLELRRERARALVASLDRERNNDEWAKLGDVAFDLVAPIYRQRAAGTDVEKTNTAAIVLSRCATPARAKQLRSLYEADQPPDGTSGILLLALGRVDPHYAFEAAKHVVETTKENAGGRGAAIEVLCNSKEASDYLLSVLADPKSPDDLRSMAYVKLARLAGARGAEAVLRDRDKRWRMPAEASEDEAILAAALEARLQIPDLGQKSPAFRVPEGMRTDVFKSIPGLEIGDKGNPQFVASSRGFVDNRLIAWSKDRQEARVQIETRLPGFAYGLEFTVHKFGADWLVVDVRETFIT